MIPQSFRNIENIIIAEFSEKVKIRSLASNARKWLTIYFSIFVTPFDGNVLSSVICVIYGCW